MDFIADLTESVISKPGLVYWFEWLNSFHRMIAGLGAVHKVCKGGEGV